MKSPKIFAICVVIVAIVYACGGHHGTSQRQRELEEPCARNGIGVMYHPRLCREQRQAAKEIERGKEAGER